MFVVGSSLFVSFGLWRFCTKKIHEFNLHLSETSSRKINTIVVDPTIVLPDEETHKTVPFTLSKSFVPRVLPWRPLSADTKLRSDVAVGLQLSEEEVINLEDALNSLLTRSGEIQSEDAYVTTDGEGNQIVLLAPVSQKWTGVKEDFSSKLSRAIGKPKADFLLSNSANELGIITGNFGTIPRVIKFVDHRAMKAKYPQNPKIMNWTVYIVSGELAEQSYSHYFPKEQQSFFKKGQKSNYFTPEGELSFNDPPAFLKPLIQNAE
jgi:hypothetical protein